MCRSLFVSSVAGSGKTATLVATVQQLNADPRRILVAAYNKSIERELKDRIGNRATVRTLHSFGFYHLQRALGWDNKVQVNDEATYRQCLYIADKLEIGENKDRHGLAIRAKHVCRYARLNFEPVSSDLVQRALCHAELDWDNDDVSPALTLSSIVLDSKLKAFRQKRTKVVDFEDQLWLPLVGGIHLGNFEWVLIDEAQDLNPAQVEMVLRASAQAYRVMFGDPHQSIYAFNFADPKASEHLIERTEAHQLPLSVSYRCPKRVVALAKRYVPQIEAAPDAIEGSVLEIDDPCRCWDYLRNLPPDTSLVLCRANAPLLYVAKTLWSERIPARLLRGQDRGRVLLGLMKQILGKDRVLPSDVFLERLDSYAKTEIERRKKAKLSTTSFIDNLDTLCIFFDTETDTDGVQNLIRAVVQNTNGLTLSTIHGAKGLEAEHVAWLGPEIRRKGSPNQQELNVQYVAITRTKQTLALLYGLTTPRNPFQDEWDPDSEGWEDEDIAD